MLVNGDATQVSRLVFGLFLMVFDESAYISGGSRGASAGGKDGEEQQGDRLHLQLHAGDAVHHLTRSVFSFSPFTRHHLRAENLSPEMSWSAI